MSNIYSPRFLLVSQLLKKKYLAVTCCCAVMRAVRLNHVWGCKAPTMSWNALQLSVSPGGTAELGYNYPCFFFFIISISWITQINLSQCPYKHIDNIVSTPNRNTVKHESPSFCLHCISLLLSCSFFKSFLHFCGFLSLVGGRTYGCLFDGSLCRA